MEEYYTKKEYNALMRKCKSLENKVVKLTSKVAELEKINKDLSNLHVVKKLREN